YKMGKHFLYTIGEGKFSMVAPRTNGGRGSQVGWDLCDSHQRTGRALIGCRHRAQLQESGPSGTGFPQFERSGSVDSTDSPSHRGSRTGAHFPVPVGVLRGVAFTASVGATVV